MSENMWFYEGFTDYLCDYLIEKNKLYPGQFRNKLGDAIAFTEAQKKMSFAASCRSLQTHTAFTALKKYKRMSGFYERGKLVAFCLDAKLMEQSNGAFRLPDLMTKLYTRYGFKSPFNDTVLPAVLTQLSYPTTKLFMESYVKGAQMPPWQTYFDSLGWVYVPKGGLIPSFGRYDFVYNPVEKKLFFKHVKQNSLGLQSNDVLLSIPNALPGEGFSKFFQPDKNDTLSITIQRAGNRLMLTGKADGYRKLKGSAVFGRGKTATQQRYRNLFWANKAE
jgi:predicted metalloprotease with PDZ domain